MILEQAKTWARNVKRNAKALRLASRDPRVPWYAKAIAAAVLAYALSPIDLIPDFIPVLGYLDDVVIVPAGIIKPGELRCKERVGLKSRTARSPSRIALSSPTWA